MDNSVALLPLPPPCQSWLALSNDPDNTRFQDWQELDRVIWQQLRLPFSDAFFLTSHNQNLPDQVSLASHPEILHAHPHDTMHTWGDFVFAPHHPFTREAAQQGLDLLDKLNARPRVWTDHSNFSGNLLFLTAMGGRPEVVDKAGHRYRNHDYSADLVHRAGVRYLWDGTLGNGLPGQDRPVGRREWYDHMNYVTSPWKVWLLAELDRWLAPLWRQTRSGLFNYATHDNRAYRPLTLHDGQRFYGFPRYGSWEGADIDGLGKILAPERVERLLAAGGVCIHYTHLGKRRVERLQAREHIPPATRVALENLADLYANGRLMLSGTARLLDYLVLRDHARVHASGIEFLPDPIRFPRLEPADLAGFAFGVRCSHLPIPFTVTCKEVTVPHQWHPVGEGRYRLTLHPDS